MNYMKAPANVRADWTVYEGLGEPVADVHGTEDRARLIAAAPALLEALRELVDYFGPSPDADNGLDEALGNARAAIAVATKD